jgi:hypothetical protein
LIDGLKVTHLPWPETLVLQSKDKIDVDPQDGTFVDLLIQFQHELMNDRSAARNGLVSQFSHALRRNN